MANEKEKIIAMLEEGKINADDAAKLLYALGEPQPGKPQAESYGSAVNNPDLKGKKLRVKVEGTEAETGDIRVNVAVPLALAKLADGIITNVVPKEANKHLKDQGIDLSSLNLGEIIDTLTDIDEDIVNIDINSDGEPMKVRVYVE
jgi:hypothetical protein